MDMGIKCGIQGGLVMRKIAFRAWDNQNNCMAIASSKKYSPINTSQCLAESAIQDSYILMQYTGLKDKNGVEIYEGDVYHHITTGKRCKIVFGDGRFYCNAEGLSSYSLLNINNGEVIGNIHENPELLDS